MVINVKMLVSLWVRGPAGVLEMFYILIRVVVKHIYIYIYMYVSVCVYIYIYALKLFSEL